MNEIKIIFVIHEVVKMIVIRNITYTKYGRLYQVRKK